MRFLYCFQMTTLASPRLDDSVMSSPSAGYAWSPVSESLEQYCGVGILILIFAMPPFAAVSIPGLQEDEGGDAALKWDKVVSEQSAKLDLGG